MLADTQAPYSKLLFGFESPRHPDGRVRLRCRPLKGALRAFLKGSRRVSVRVFGLSVDLKLPHYILLLIVVT